MGWQRSRPSAVTAANTGEEAPANKSRRIRQRGMRCSDRAGPEDAGAEAGAGAEGAEDRGGVSGTGGACAAVGAGAAAAEGSSGRTDAMLASPSQWGVF